MPGHKIHRGLLTVLLAATAISATAAQPTEEEEQARLGEIADADTMIMVPMRDGVGLATDVYLPRDREGPVPTLFVKTPYDFNRIEGPQLQWALEATERGYAFVVQNERGRFYSEGEWEILGNPQQDGWDSLDWVAEQPWSDGSVGTLGCSSSAEWQLSLAALDHPAHKAMVPMAAGAGIGRVGEFHEQGNWYKGGVHQTLFSVWLYHVQQNLRPQFPAGLSQEQLQRLRKMYDLAATMPEVNWKQQLAKLPASEWPEQAGANTGPWAELITRKPDDPGWYQGGLYHDDQDFGVPAFWFNSWFDVSQGPNLALFNHVRNNASDRAVRDGQYVVIAPTLHCGFYNIPEHEDLLVGELNVGRPALEVWDQVFAFFDHYLKEEANDFAATTHGCSITPWAATPGAKPTAGRPGSQ
ncbi:CocE/NonD family hydrolase [Kineobactrum salinum]|uniref:CocE/NonD family hydrolase n=1 Tax=Kineobactrum salinum TaxID=2708301 RepID=UPI0018D850B7|nr:CocE/NonD family hydrolase [Kineobactrum salinum]